MRASEVAPDDPRNSATRLDPGRRRGRAARQATRLARAMDTLPYLTRKLPPVEVVSADGLEAIEHNADTLLEEVGIEIVNFPEAVEIFRGAGADVDGHPGPVPARHVPQARPGHGAARSSPSAPATRRRSVLIGDPYMVLVPTYGSPFIHNLDEGRRYATIEDFRNFVKLTYMSPTLHHGGGTLCEPVDLPVNKRHLEMVYSHIRYSDRAFMGSVTHPSRAQDSVDMARIVFGAETMEREHVIMGLANANSPMSWDFNMLGSAKVYAENNQIMLITPFILGGAMAPVTVAAPATQTLAEALAGMAFCQIVRPGAPVIFGSFASSMSMQSGRADVRHARAAARAVRDGGARPPPRRPVPQWRQLHGLQDPRLPGGLRERRQLHGHDAGRRELQPAHGRLARGRARHRLREVHARRGPGVDGRAYVGGVDLSENGLALQAMLDGGPGQHFLGSPHTLANFENAFWRSRAVGQQQLRAVGARRRRTTPRCAPTPAGSSRLAEYERPPLDEGVHEELRGLDGPAARRASPTRTSRAR